jgi:hypothetical protein
MVISMTVFLACLPKLARAQVVSGSGWTAETSVAPAAANFGGNVYLGWKGASSNQIWYTEGPSPWSHQATVSGALTTQAPALAAGSALYLAWRGQSTASTDKIYYTTNSGSGFGSHATVCNTGGCAETIASPALAANGATVYVAWTTSSDEIMIGTYTGAWTFTATPPSFLTSTAPALALYDGQLFLAWLNEGTNQLMYATSPSSSISWPATGTQVGTTTWSAQTGAAPAFGIYVSEIVKTPNPAGLYIGWTTESGTITIDYSHWNGSGWNAPAAMPPPSPDLVTNTTPALVSYAIAPECEVSNYYFDVAYKNGGDDIIWTQLQDNSAVPCATCCPKF